MTAFAAGPSPHEDCLADEIFIDEVRGGVLETERVKHARQEEVQWSFVRTWRQKEPRVDAGRPNCRSRLVVREIKKAMKRSEVPLVAELFGGMPPLESVKALLSLFVSHSREKAKGKRTLAMYDISRAHFHGAPVRIVFVELPYEEKELLARENGHDLEYVGLVRKCRYGTVHAIGRWQVGKRIMRRY